MLILVPVLVSLGLIAVNGVFVAAEFAVIGARKTRMSQLASDGNRTAAAVLRLLESPVLQDRYISTAQLGITVASLGLGMYAEEAFAELLLSPLEHLAGLGEVAAHGVAGTLALILLTYLHVVVGEMVPKSLALQHPESTALGILRPMTLTQKILAPIVWLLNKVGAGVLRLLGIPLVGGHERVLSPEELQMIIDDSFRGGQLDAVEKAMLSAVFMFGEHKAHQIMTHRTRVEAYPVDIPEDELLDQLSRSRFSRFPIYDGTLDNVVGILHLKDLVRQQIHHPGEFDLRALMRRAPVVPEYADAESVLASLKRLHLHMAIVIDEYGGMAGIITLEDLVEEVVGEVQDEFDQEIPLIRQVGPHEFLVRGDFPLEDLEELSNPGQDLPDVNSVGGLIVLLLDRMPRPGDRVSYAGIAFTAETVVNRAVQTARVLLPEVGSDQDGVE
jgi:CBS domain containing-hemolysin-like protein